MYSDLITIPELAAMIGLSEYTVRSDVSRRPEVLPPRIIFPGSRRVRWSRAAVLRWLNKHTKPV